MIFRLLICGGILLAALAGCGPNYSPDTYASNAAQQANKAEQGVVVGVREVSISAAGTVGTVTGAAAGGIAGSQAGPGPVNAFTALGGSLLGGLAGNAAEHAMGDTKAFEYIVRKPNGDLLSVTQKDTTPLALGQKVLVIVGNQARVVPDYTVAVEPPAKDKSVAAGKDKPAAAVKDKPADPDAGKPPGVSQETGPPAPASTPPSSTVVSPAAAQPAAGSATSASGAAVGATPGAATIGVTPGAAMATPPPAPVGSMVPTGVPLADQPAKPAESALPAGATPTPATPTPATPIPATPAPQPQAETRP